METAKPTMLRLKKRRNPLKGGMSRLGMGLLGALLLLPMAVQAQSPAPEKSAAEAGSALPSAPDYSNGPKAFPLFYRSYMPQHLPAPALNNSRTVTALLHEGKLELSGDELVPAVVENNLGIAVARYNNFFAQTDLLRAKGGQAARGVEGAGVQVPNTLFSAAIGAGVGNVGGVGGIGNFGSITGAQRGLNISPRGAFDPTLIANFSWDRTTSPLNSLVVAGLPFVTPVTTFGQVAYQQAFPTGTSFSVTFSNQRQSSTQKSLIYNPDVISRLSVNFVQQVLNGFGFAVNQRFQHVARNDIKIVREWFRQQVITTVAQAQNAYWDLVAAQEQVKAAQQAVAAAQALLEDNKARESFGTLAPVDVTSAQSDLAARQRDLVVAQTNLQVRETGLKIFFSRDVNDVLGAAEVAPLDPLPEPKDSDIPPLAEAVRTAMENRPEIPQQEGAVLNDEVAVKFTRNFMKPTFNIFGLLATGGLSGNQLVKGVVLPGGLSEELRQLINFEYPEYAFGFALSIPIKNRSAQADNVRANLDEHQAETTLQNTRNQIQQEVRTAVVGLQQAKAQVEASERALQYIRQSSDAAQTKFEAGVATPYDVTLARRDLLNAEFADVQARVAYAKAQVELDRAMGVTLEKHHISMEEAVAGRVARAGQP